MYSNGNVRYYYDINKKDRKMPTKSGQRLKNAMCVVQCQCMGIHRQRSIDSWRFRRMYTIIPSSNGIRKKHRRCHYILTLIQWNKLNSFAACVCVRVLLMYVVWRKIDCVTIAVYPCTHVPKYLCNIENPTHKLFSVFKPFTVFTKERKDLFCLVFLE